MQDAHLHGLGGVRTRKTWHHPHRACHLIELLDRHLILRQKAQRALEVQGAESFEINRRGF